MDTFVRKGHEGVKFFVGPEVEQTPAFSKKTLFVVGLQDTALVERLAREHKTPHIFLSANRSFDSVEMTDSGVYKVGDTLASDWEKQINHLLDKGFMVSLDYPAHKHAMVLKILNAGIWQSRNFVPVLSVAIPHVSTSSPNLTVKIDDINFKATNPGVWCMHHHEVTDSNRFTDWQEYGNDLVLTEDQIAPHVGPAHTLPLRIKNPANPPAETTPIGKGAPEEERTVLHIEVEGDVTPEQVQAVVQNFTELGLDPDGKSRLKPDANEEQSTVTVVATPKVAAEAYADGATADPLGKEASKTPKAKKAAK